MQPLIVDAVRILGGLAKPEICIQTRSVPDLSPVRKGGGARMPALLNVRPRALELQD